MKKIALDVDGVLLNFMPAFDKAASIVLGKEIIVHKDENQMDYYHLGKRVQTTQDKVDEILEYMQTSRMYANLEPLPGAKEALLKIKESGFLIYNVTALPEKAQDMRLENLKKALDFVPEGIYCVGMGMSKTDALQLLQPDVFIDDRIDYLAQAPVIYHLAWIDQKEAQKDMESVVDCHVHSLLEWTEKHLPRLTKKLDRQYSENLPLQLDLKLESVKRKYAFR